MTVDDLNGAADVFARRVVTEVDTSPRRCRSIGMCGWNELGELRPRAAACPAEDVGRASVGGDIVAAGGPDHREVTVAGDRHGLAEEIVVRGLFGGEVGDQRVRAVRNLVEEIGRAVAVAAAALVGLPEHRKLAAGRRGGVDEGATS